MRKEKPVGPRGFSRWILPTTSGYLLGCCDCGLIHEVQFRAVKVLRRHANGSKRLQALSTAHYQVEFRARRADRLTAAERRRMAKR